MKEETNKFLKMVKTLLVVIAFVFMLMPFMDVYAHRVHVVVVPGENEYEEDVEHEQLMMQPGDPERDGYVFDGWYEDDTYNVPFDFEHNLIDRDMNIYAKWSDYLEEARVWVTLPTIGAHPVLTGDSEVPSDYTVNSVQFYLGNEELDTNYTYLAETSYIVYVQIRPRAGAKFDYQHSRVYINDRVASYYGSANDSYNTLIYTISYDTPAVGEISISSNPENVDFDTFVTGFDNTFSIENAKSVRIYNTGSVSVTIDITNPSAEGPFGNIAFDAAQVLAPNDYMDISLIVPTSSAYSDTPDNYNANYVITATDTTDPNNTFDLNIGAHVNLLLNQQFEVSFNTHGGSEVAPQYVWTWQSANVPDPEPTRNGFVFMGWSTTEECNSEFDFYNSPITDNITLHACWAEAVTVTIDVNGGNALSQSVFVVPKGISFMEVAGMLQEEPTHSNALMYLSGIKINSLDSDPLTDEQMAELIVNADMTVYFVWEEAEAVEGINIEIYPDVAGYEVEVFYNSNNDTYEPTMIPSLHWDDDDRYGVFNPDYVVGECDAQSNDCDVLFEGTFVAGNDYYARIPLSTDVSKGHGFTTASMESVHITGGTLVDVQYRDVEHMVVYVKFTATERDPGGPQLPEYATMTFDSLGGTEIAPITLPGGEEELAPDCEKAGYIFGGWYFIDEYDQKIVYYPGDNIYFDADRTLTAIWYDEAHRITSVSVGLEPLFIGDVVEIVQVQDPNDPNNTWDEQAPIPDVYSNSENYHIGHREWVTSGKCDPENPEESYFCGETFEGEVQENTYYYVVIDVQAEDGYFFDENILQHITVNGEAPEEVWENYLWDDVTFIGKVRSVKENYEVRFMDGEAELFRRTVHYKNQVEEPNPAPTKPDNGNIRYEFAGWYSDITLNSAFAWETPITADIEIYAKWNEVDNGTGNQNNKIVHYYDGETLIATEEVTDKAFPLNPAPTKNGFTFDKWYADPELTVEYDFNQTIDGNSLNLYAKFIRNKSSIQFTVTATGTIINMQINGTNVIDENVVQSSPVNVTVENAGYYDESNSIRIIPMFGEKLLASVTINGVEYTGESANVTVNADEWVIVVPGSESYTVVAVADETSQVPRTIIWANVDANENASEYDADMVLEHGSARIIGVYNDNNVKIGDEVDVDNNGMGYAVIEPGSRVIFEFVPEYGYQLTSVLANELVLEPQAGVNRYEFIMPDTNVHFQATFKQTKDIVKSNTSKVESGSITLGGDLEGGSARLTISDVELTSDKIKNFEDAAKDYTLKTYLDIDLYNIFYKGKDDANDVWSNKIDELDKEATITIKLADDVDVSNVVLVHNVHDGDTYEIIEILSYDKTAHTITFKTKSFSNYAIAVKNQVEDNSNTNNSNTTTNNTKTEEATTTPATSTNTNASSTASNPKTFDNIGIYAGLLIVSIVGLLLVALKNHKKKRI